MEHWFLFVVLGGLAVIGLIVLAIVRKQWGWGILAIPVFAGICVLAVVGAFRSQRKNIKDLYASYGTSAALSAYIDLLGFPINRCVHISDFTDEENFVSGMHLLHLRVQTCPAAVEHELDYRLTSWELIASEDAAQLDRGARRSGAYSPTELGDPVLLFMFENYPPEWMHVYLSLDSTDMIVVGEVQ